MKIKCIAIDDEPLALEQLSGYIRKTEFLELVGTFHNALEATAWLSDHTTDLIFADINMPALNGLDFVRSLDSKPLVIFITAYSEYALEGFRVDATDYLLKPIGYADFLRSAEKAYKQHCLLSTVQKKQEQHRTIFVRSEYKTIPVALEKILFIESRSEYVRIFLEGQHPIMSLGSLRSYEEKLPKEQFMRTHRSYIINLLMIKSIGKKHITMVNGKEIPLGKLYEPAFRKYSNPDAGK